MNLPRKGRKGGKVTTPIASSTSTVSTSTTAKPVISPLDAATPAAISPSAAIGGSAASLSEITAVTSASSKPTSECPLLFSNELVISSELSISSPEGQGIASSWIDNKVQIHKDTAQHVGRGNVVRGMRTLKVILSPPESSFEVVRKKMNEVLEKQKDFPYEDLKSLPDSVDVVGNNHVVIIYRFHCVRLALQLVEKKTVPNSKVLVVVSRFEEISVMASVLREILKADNKVAEVCELCGAWRAGDSDYPISVTDAETAILYLSTGNSFTPFTHVVFPELLSLTPTVSLFFHFLKLFLHRSYALNFRKSEVRNKQKSKTNVEEPAEMKDKEQEKSEVLPIVKVAIGTTLKLSEKLRSLFTISPSKSAAFASFSFKNMWSDMRNAASIVEFSYDECCALVQSSVLQLAGASSLRLPEKRAMQHCVAVAAQLITCLTRESTQRQIIHIYTGDCSAVTEILRAELRSTGVLILGKRDATDRSPFSSPVKGREKSSVVYVLSNTDCPFVCEFVPPHFVLDFGTTAQPIQTGRSEGLAGGYLCVWSSREELEDHCAMVRPGGGYFHLYPTLSDSRPSSSLSCAITELERALLQSVRHRCMQFWDSNPLLAIPSSVITTVWTQLVNMCLTTERSELTLCGEIATRLPLNINLAVFVIHACALHLGELGVVIACVSTFCMRDPQCNLHDSEEEETPWRDRIEKSRREHAPDLVTESDILADAVVYLEWHRLMLEGDKRATSTLPIELGVSLFQLQRIRLLIKVVCRQLSDYLMLEDLESPGVAGSLQRQLSENFSASLLCFLYAVSLASHAALFRKFETENFWEGGDASFAFVRAARKMIPSKSVPSHVVVGTDATLISTDIGIGTSSEGFEGARFTVLNTVFFHAALLLLYPTIAYSAPQLEVGNGKQWCSVSFSLVCNGHRKRYRVTLSQAKAILQFRQKMNLALDFLHMHRVLPRPTSQIRFFDALRARNRCFHLKHFLLTLRKELYDLSINIDAFEHHRNVDFTYVHSLRSSGDVLSTEVEPADKALLRSFDNMNSGASSIIGDLKSVLPTSSQGSNDSCLRFSENSSASAREGDEPESREDIYFLNHEPIIDL